MEQQQRENEDTPNNASSSSSASSPPPPSPPSTEGTLFECNICFDQASDPVVSLCGHLYCWPCIHQWMESQDVPLCPVCKAGISKDKVVPVYCRGKEATDPRQNTVPNRPQGQRSAPERQFPHFQDPFGGFHRGGHFHNNANFHFSMGFGLFPSLFGFQFAFPDAAGQQNAAQPNGQGRLTQLEEQQALLSRVFMLIGLLLLFILLVY